MLLVIFVFSLVFLYQIKNVFWANFIYYLWYLKEPKISITNKKCFVFYIIFMIEIVVSMIYYKYVLHGTFSNHVLLQFMFSLQYYILFLKINIDTKKFEKYFITFAVTLSTIIIISFFIVVGISGIPTLFTLGRLWGKGFLPGWPNVIIIPLLYGEFFLLENTSTIWEKWYFKGIIIIACILTTSRAGLLGIACIGGYFIFHPEKGINKKYLKKIMCGVLAVIFAGIIFGIMIETNASLKYRLSVSYDRENIFFVCKQLIGKSPILGYGGTSLDILMEIYPVVGSVMDNWGHAHNFILETLLRYGFAGLILLLAMLGSLFIKLKNMNNKFMFLFMWFLALFQVYERNFVFIFMITYLTIRDKLKIDEKG